MLLEGLELGSDELSWRKKVKRGAGSTQQQRTEGGGGETGERRIKGEELCSKLKKRLSAVG